MRSDCCETTPSVRAAPPLPTSLSKLDLPTWTSKDGAPPGGCYDGDGDARPFPRPAAISGNWRHPWRSVQKPPYRGLRPLSRTLALGPDSTTLSGMTTSPLGRYRSGRGPGSLGRHGIRAANEIYERSSRRGSSVRSASRPVSPIQPPMVTHWPSAIMTETKTSISISQRLSD